MNLKNGATLQQGEFTILQTLGQGGFGITYLALQRSLNRKVAIKEFFMADYCQREDADGMTMTVPTHSNKEYVGKCKKRFKREAQFIANLQHPNIVAIYSIFEENDTSYYVMEYLPGGSLHSLANNSPIDEWKAIDFIKQIASALSLMHSNEQMHLDVKPGNIMLRDDRTAVLIDFGLTKQFENGHQMTSTRVAYTPNYAPLEQHTGVRTFSPRIDLYALGATLYFLLTGKNPPMADEVFNDGLPALPVHISESTRKTVVKAMRPKAKDRQASVSEFAESLIQGDKASKTKPKTKKNSSQTTIKADSSDDVAKTMNISGSFGQEHRGAKPKSRKWLKWLSVISVIVLGVVFGYSLLSGNAREMAVKEVNPADVQTYTVNGVSFDMVSVEGGTFTMGATSEQGDDADRDETPTHQVTLSDYMIGQTEVTQKLWQAVMDSNPSYFKGDNLPVETVSWKDCQDFVKKLNELTQDSRPQGMVFRLPTEAEWEYAARGGNKSKGYKYSGDDEIDNVAWYYVNSYDKGTSSPDYGTHAVGTKSANELGLYDMAGNVYEWCYDFYGDYSRGSQTNPKGPSTGSYRVHRGGSWDYGARICRVSNRGSDNPGYRGDYHGVRVCLGRAL